jgi:DNA replication protein DnaC
LIELEFIRLAEVVEAREACSKCAGRDSCRNDPQGYVPRFTLDDRNNLYFSLAACDREMAHRRIRKIEWLVKSSRIPEHFKTRTFNTFRVTFENREAYETAVSIADDPERKGMVIAGMTGVGKTHLAAAIMNKRMEDGDEAVFVTVPELLADIRRVIRSEQETSELLEVVKSAELLIMDDLGAERTTGWVAEQLYTIINARYERKKQTVITTNYMSAPALITKLSEKDKAGVVVDDFNGKRIVSRLCEMCEWVLIQGKDWRLTA